MKDVRDIMGRIKMWQQHRRRAGNINRAIELGASLDGPYLWWTEGRHWSRLQHSEEPSERCGNITVQTLKAACSNRMTAGDFTPRVFLNELGRKTFEQEVHGSGRVRGSCWGDFHLLLPALLNAWKTGLWWWTCTLNFATLPWTGTRRDCRGHGMTLELTDTHNKGCTSCIALFHKYGRYKGGFLWKG